jgi:hypothetical protein
MASRVAPGVGKRKITFSLYVNMTKNYFPGEPAFARGFQAFTA